MIELLVVIAIIALLLAILMPSLRRARNSARAVVCQSRLKQWGTIFYMYTEYNHYRFLNSLGDALWFIRGSQLEEGDPNVAPMSTYVNAKGIGYCPMAVKPTAVSTKSFSYVVGVTGASYTLKGMKGSVFESWKLNNPTPEFYGSYGFNYELFNFTFYSNVRNRQVWGSGINVLNLDRAYRFPVLLDCISPFDSINLKFFSNDFCINRHEGCINGLFMDWSVRKIGLKELWTLKWNMTFDTANRWTIAGGVKPEDWPEWMRGFKDY